MAIVSRQIPQLYSSSCVTEGTCRSGMVASPWMSAITVS